ncbi:MAG: hypothetical protein J7M24_07335, partial [Candidatus Latescibacteria bacterium]|nr:hypothetical protein [Candidatus Latescibacterota bacterium]
MNGTVAPSSRSRTAASTCFGEIESSPAIFRKCDSIILSFHCVGNSLPFGRAKRFRRAKQRHRQISLLKSQARMDVKIQPVQQASTA